MRMLIVLLLFSSAAQALDFKCFEDCTAKGYQYGLCQSRCDEQPKPEPVTYQTPKQTDFLCVNDCTGAGYSLLLCQNKCSN